MSLIGYARVSSLGQNLDIQLEKLEYCEKRYFRKRKAEHLINAPA